MKKVNMALFAVVCLCNFALSAQALKPSDLVPSADGKISSGEYVWRTNQKGAEIAFSISSDGSILYVALNAPTAGWVAVGLGSLKMTGAYMVLGNDSDGKTEISEQTGKGFRHTPNDKEILISKIVKEANGRTVLEFSVPSTGFIKDGKIESIIAWSTRDSFTTRHSVHLSVTVPVQTK